LTHTYKSSNPYPRFGSVDFGIDVAPALPGTSEAGSNALNPYPMLNRQGLPSAAGADDNDDGETNAHFSAASALSDQWTSMIDDIESQEVHTYISPTIAYYRLDTQKFARIVLLRKQLQDSCILHDQVGHNIAHLCHVQQSQKCLQCNVNIRNVIIQPCSCFAVCSACYNPHANCLWCGQVANTRALVINNSVGDPLQPLL